MANGIRINQLKNFKGESYALVENIIAAAAAGTGLTATKNTNGELTSIGTTLKLKKVATTEGYAASYALFAGDTQLGTTDNVINILKDQFVNDGALVWSTSDSAPDADNSQASKDATHIYPAMKLSLWTRINPDGDFSDSNSNSSSNDDEGFVKDVYFPIASMFTDYVKGNGIDITSGTISAVVDASGDLTVFGGGTAKAVSLGTDGIKVEAANIQSAAKYEAVAAANSAITNVNSALTATVTDINSAISGSVAALNTAVTDAVNTALAGHRALVETEETLTADTAGKVTVTGITGRVLKVYQGDDEVYPEITCTNGTNTLVADFGTAGPASGTKWTILHTADAATTVSVAATASTASATAASALATTNA